MLGKSAENKRKATASGGLLFRYVKRLIAPNNRLEWTILKGQLIFFVFILSQEKGDRCVKKKGEEGVI